MIISPTSIWLIGKPRHILACLSALAAEHKYVKDVLLTRQHD